MTGVTKTSEEIVSINNINDEVTVYPTTLLNNVAENCKFYTHKEIEGAKKARKLQQVLGWPGTSTFKSYLNNNLITNSEVTADDVSRAEHIFGVPIPLLRGKMTNTLTPHSTATIKKKKLPLPVSPQHQRITLFVDFFYINKLPFLHTTSEKINVFTVLPATSRSQNTIIQELRSVCELYKARGFKVTDCHGDNEFDIKSLKDEMKEVSFDICTKDEHVDEIERSC